MKNKISIDELVRQGIAKGEESHNLGAWANMERMLDGQNPYEQEKEESKRKPWLFMLLGLVVCSTAVLGGYNYFSGNDIAPNKVVVTQKANNSLISQASPAFDKDNTITESIRENNAVESASDNKNVELNNVSNNASVFSDNNFASDKSTTANSKNRGAIANKINSNTPIAQSNIDSKIASTQKVANAPLADKQSSKKTTTTRSTKRTKVAANNLDQIAQKTIDKNNTPAVAAKPNTANIDIDNKNNIPPTIVQSYLDTIPATKLTQRVVYDQNGNKKYVTDSSKFKAVVQKERVVVNPRFVALTVEQEKDAQRKTALASISNDIDAPSMQSMQADMQKSDPSVGLSAQATNANTSETIETKSKKGFFSVFRDLGQKVKQKSVSIAHTPLPIYTGMFVGVNAAFNKKHNFGGFQGGFTAMTPLSRLFSLQAEARFMHKNNSGYTVTDNRSTIKNTTIDSTSFTKGKIYNYEIDSVTTGYNLKSFYTVQVPILLNLHVKKFNAYAGVHLNYGLRMNTSASQNSNPLYITDTVLASSSYNQRTNTSTQFTSDDFGSRLGLGYTVGGSYNFNPSLYLDLRMSNLFWDNSKGAAKQEISDVFFKMPSFQLSLGYRFRKFDRERQ